MPNKVLYTAEVISTGDGRNGHVLSSDHRLDLDLSVPPELGGPGGDGTNPSSCSRPATRPASIARCGAWPARRAWTPAIPR